MFPMRVQWTPSTVPLSLAFKTNTLTIAQRERIFAQRYGVTHLAVVNLRTQMAEIRRSIADELNRIAESYKSDYEIGKGRVQTLETNLKSLISDSQLTNRDRIGLRDLESTARIYHSIYDNFLNRYMEAAQQQSFPFTEARMISAAEPPTYQSAPNTHSVLVTAAFVGLILGFAAGFCVRRSIACSAQGTKSKRYCEPTVSPYCRA